MLGDASEPLVELTRFLGYPITNTLMGLGAYPGTDPQFVGMLGMHGTYEANMAMHECDVLIAIGGPLRRSGGGRFPKQFCPHARIVHVDIDPSSISKDHPGRRPHRRAGAGGSSRSCWRRSARANRRPDEAALKAWWKRIDGWRGNDCLRYERGSDLIKPQYVVEKLYEVTDGEAFVTSDVGQHQMWAAQFYPFAKPRRWVNSGGPRHHGVRPSCRHGGAVRVSGRTGRLHHGRGEAS